MKKLSLAILIMVIALMGAFSLTACKKDEQESEAKTKSFTVTYYDGETVLKEESVKEGDKVTAWTPAEKEGYDFIGWYVDEGLNRLFDFEKETISENRSLYAGYAEKSEEDTRDWAILGFGKGDLLSSSNWGKVITEQHKLTKVENENKFTITLDLYAGDEFQFATDINWMNQRGIGYVGPTDRSMMVDGEEVVVLSGIGGIGETASKQKNIKVEYDGNYTFTLTTHPKNDYYDPDVNGGKVSISDFDSITWKHNGPAAKLAATRTEYYIKGKDITQWASMYNPATQMEHIGSTYTKTIYLKANDEFMFVSKEINNETGEETPSTATIKFENLDDESKELFEGSGNIKVKTSGEYTLTYNADTKKLHAELNADAVMQEDDYYLDGKFGDMKWNESFFNPDYKFTKNNKGIYTLKGIALKADDEIVVQSFKKDATDKADKLAAYNFLYCNGTGDAFEAANAEGKNYNIKVLVAGTYNIEFDPYSKMIKIVDANMQHTVYVKGSFAPGWKITGEDGKLLDAYKLTETSKGIFEITMTISDADVADGKNWACMFMVDTTNGSDGKGINVNNLGADADNNVNSLFRVGKPNIETKTAGTYRFVFDLENEVVNVYLADK